KSARPQAVTEALHGARFEGGWTKAMPGGAVQFDRAGLNTLSTPIMVQWRSKELVTGLPKDVALAASVWHALASLCSRSNATHRHPPGHTRGRCGISGLGRGVPARLAAIRPEHRPKTCGLIAVGPKRFIQLLTLIVRSV